MMMLFNFLSDMILVESDPPVDGIHEVDVTPWAELQITEDLEGLKNFLRKEWEASDLADRKIFLELFKDLYGKESIHHRISLVFLSFFLGVGVVINM